MGIQELLRDILFTECKGKDKLLLAVLMILPLFASCNGGGTNEPDGSKETDTQPTTTEAATEDPDDEVQATNATEMIAIDKTVRKRTTNFLITCPPLPF